MEVGRQGRQRASETIRKQKRKELDARRSKCRIRIGTHLEQWCRLKEQLGFSLHSQLAKYLLDSTKSHTVDTCLASRSRECPRKGATAPEAVLRAGLQWGPHSMQTHQEHLI
uniref:Zinc finger protein 692 n=1 Tax=Varanus komodoensis TaxID=61221 RepID=A0A8D2Q550_VARKO